MDDYSQPINRPSLETMIDPAPIAISPETLLAEASLLEAFFDQSLSGFFFMMLDRPIQWDAADQEALLDYVFSHQRVTKVNAAMLAQYDATEVEFIGLTPQDFFAHDLEIGRQLWRELFSKGKLHVETFERKLNGNFMWIEGDYSCLYNSDGAIIGHCGIQRDISEAKRDEVVRKRSQEELLRSQQNLTDFIENAIVCLHWVAADGTIIWANQAELDLLGYTHEEYIGHSITEFHVNQDAITDILQRLLSNQPVREYKTDLRCKDGSIRHVLIDSNSSWQDGQFMRTRCFTRDITDRTRAEEALRQSEQKFRAIFDGTFQFIGVLTPEGRVTEANRTALDAIAVNLADVVGQLFWETPWWAHSPVLKEQLKQAINRASKGELVRFEAEHILAGGTSIFVDFSLKPVFNEAGMVIMLIPEGRDITERKLVESQLRQQEEFLKSIYDGIEQAVFVVDLSADGELRYANFNPVSEKYAGVTNAQIQGKTPEEAFGEAFGSTLRHNYELCLKTGASIVYEEQLEFELHNIWTLTTLSPLKNEQGQIYRIIGTAIDISDRKQKEDVLRNISLGVSTKTDKFLFQALAEYLTKTLGVDFAFIGELIPPENNRIRTLAGYGEGQVLENFEYALANTPSDKVVGKDFCIYANGVQTQFPLDAYLKEMNAESFMGAPLFNSAGKVLGLITILSHQPWQDTSLMAEILNIFAVRAAAELERQRAETVLQNQKQELTRSNAELQQFAYVASHDLQEPLRMITSYLELLERRYKGQLDAKADQFINYAVDGATRMQTLINDLLSYSRVGSRGQSFEWVDCEKIIQNVLANLNVTIAQSDATITHDALPKVNADASQLTQLFQNLIGNALKFQHQDPPQVHIAVQGRDDKWLFSVRDNGIGIEAQYLDQIFVIFQRLHSRTEYSGTGIGLAICKKIVERHGGSLWVESEPNEGSIFYFTLPYIAGNIL